jgi:hypothetical protein
LGVDSGKGGGEGGGEGGGGVGSITGGPGTGGFVWAGVAVGMEMMGKLKRTWGVILSGLGGMGMGIGGCSVGAS